ncbi:MAG: acyl-ACP--UDP-N-acetylglucosamine O-acyltransferase [Myxococcota bacterium]
MPEIHPTAILDGDVELAADVQIGPHCVIRGRVQIGEETRLIGHVYLEGPLVLGAHNLVYPFTTLGFAPQDLSFPPDREGAGLVIGDQNRFRESVTISRATGDAPTRIGDRNYWMANTHAGHDSEIGNDCVIANGTLLGGWVRVGDNVFAGGNVAVHQRCQLGRGSFLTGSVGLNKDLPPFFMLTGGNVAGSINLIGMRRSGMPSDQIDDVKWVYKKLYRSSLPLRKALDEIEERGDRPLVAEYLTFLRGMTQGLCPHRGEARRGTGLD